MRYLSIDYGKKRIGLAISDEEAVFAFPYKIVVNNLEFIDTIHNICGQENVTAIVLGESVNASGDPNKIMGSIEEVKKNLEGELGIPVHLEKEFMTTIHAREMMKEAFGVSKKRVNTARKVVKGKEEKADASAATLILQRFLDRKNNKNY